MGGAGSPTASPVPSWHSPGEGRCAQLSGPGTKRGSGEAPLVPGTCSVLFTTRAHAHRDNTVTSLAVRRHCDVSARHLGFLSIGDRVAHALTPLHRLAHVCNGDDAASVPSVFREPLAPKGPCLCACVSADGSALQTTGRIDLLLSVTGNKENTRACPHSRVLGDSEGPWVVSRVPWALSALPLRPRPA